MMEKEDEESAAGEAVEIAQAQAHGDDAPPGDGPVALGRGPELLPDRPAQAGLVPAILEQEPMGFERIALDGLSTRPKSRRLGRYGSGGHEAFPRSAGRAGVS